MRRILLAITVAGLLAGGVLLARGDVPCDLLAAQPSCEVALQPGPTEDTFDLISLDEVETFRPAAGSLRLTTVAVADDLTFGEWLAARTSSVIEAVPREQIYPPGFDREEVSDLNAIAMQDSQLTAIIVALENLGYELDGEGALVAGIQDDAVTDRFAVGDVIVAIDGEPVRESSDVVELVQDRRPGSTVTFELRGDGGRSRTFDVELGSAPDDPDRAYVGVLVTTEMDLPVDVTVDAGSIGGPSAGLVFALSIIELLEPGDLIGDRVIAGTGQLERDGSVTAVGGVPQKLAGAADPADGSPRAEVFLVPRGNLEQARGATVANDLLVVPVDSLEEALAALDALRHGEEPEEVLRLAAS
ncbi:MAG: PDZ domain-containing protein [Nitriliruptoraceae bacterium]